MAPFPWLLADAGFNLGDWLVPLLLVGGAIANLISQKGKAKQPPGRESPPPAFLGEDEPPSGPTAPPSPPPNAMELDELMEALGMKEPRKPKPPPVVIQPRVYSPPPPVLSPAREAMDVPREHRSIENREPWPELAHKFESRMAPSRTPTASQPSAATGATPARPDRPLLQSRQFHGHSRRDLLRRQLHHPASIRQAILLSELLRPPVAYRP